MPGLRHWKVKVGKAKSLFSMNSNLSGVNHVKNSPNDNVRTDVYKQNVWY